MNKDILLSNSLSNKKEKFVPLDNKNINCILDSNTRLNKKIIRDIQLTKIDNSVSRNLEYR